MTAMTNKIGKTRNRFICLNVNVSPVNLRIFHHTVPEILLKPLKERNMEPRGGLIRTDHLFRYPPIVCEQGI